MVSHDDLVSTARAFGTALAEARWLDAHALLSTKLASVVTADDLRTSYHGVRDYAVGPANHVEVTETLVDWPGRQRRDVGWAYVAIGGASWTEGVSVILANHDGRPRIRAIEWGRP